MPATCIQRLVQLYGEINAVNATPRKKFKKRLYIPPHQRCGPQQTQQFLALVGHHARLH